MIPYIITFISFVLDIFLSNYISIFNYNISYFTPMFTLTSLIITTPFFNNKKNYIIYSLIFGAIFDICITNTFPLNIVIYVLIAFVINFMDEKFSYNIFINVIKLIIILFIYDGLTYLILLIIGYLDYNILALINKFLKSIILNMIYLIIIYNTSNYITKKFKIKTNI